MLKYRKKEKIYTVTSATRNSRRGQFFFFMFKFSCIWFLLYPGVKRKRHIAYN